MNLSSLLASLERHTHVFDFTREELGENLARATAMGILEFMEEELDPGGTAWAELSFLYKKWKAEAYPGHKIGEVTGLMKNFDELKGEVFISPDGVTQEYGLSEETKLEAEWFQKGYEPQNRPPRHFYSFNTRASEYATKVLDERFHREIH